MFLGFPYNIYYRKSSKKLSYHKSANKSRNLIKSRILRSKFWPKFRGKWISATVYIFVSSLGSIISKLKRYISNIEKEIKQPKPTLRDTHYTENHSYLTHCLSCSESNFLDMWYYFLFAIQDGTSYYLSSKCNEL